MTFFQIGNISIPSLWLAVVSSLFLSSVIYRVINRTKVGEWYWNGFFLYFAAWKLSYILFQFKLFIDMPLSIVYFNGGIKGHFTALAIVSLYLLLSKKKYPSINQEAPGVIFLFFIMYEVLIQLLEKSWLEALLHFIVLIGFILLLLSLKRNKTLLTKPHMMVVLLVELLIISLFSTLFSTEPLTFIWMVLTVWIMLKNWTRRSTVLE